MTVSAADCAALQPRPLPHFAGGGGATQTRSPVARATACRPPGFGRVMSETAKYACSADRRSPLDAAERAALAGAVLPDHLAVLVGIDREADAGFLADDDDVAAIGPRVASIGGLPKSTSGPLVSGQFGLLARPQPVM